VRRIHHSKHHPALAAPSPAKRQGDKWSTVRWLRQCWPSAIVRRRSAPRGEATLHALDDLQALARNARFLTGFYRRLLRPGDQRLARRPWRGTRVRNGDASAFGRQALSFYDDVSSLPFANRLLFLLCRLANDNDVLVTLFGDRLDGATARLQRAAVARLDPGRERRYHQGCCKRGGYQAASLFRLPSLLLLLPELIGNLQLPAPPRLGLPAEK
jgi:hypothetical protein